MSGLVKIWEDESKFLKIKKRESLKGDLFSLHFGSMVTIMISFGGRNVRVYKLDMQATDETIGHILFDQVMPRVIAHEGDLVVHAGLVSARSTSIIVCGESGVGKSTLVASLHNAGYVLHGDDALVIDRKFPPFLGRAVYRSLRVLPDTLEQLFPVAANVCRVAHYSDKLRVALPLSANGTLAAAPLNGLIFLAPPPSDDEIKLRRMRPAESCMALIKNSFALDPTDQERAQRKLLMASSVAAAVPAFALSYPRDYARLDDVRRTLVEEGILPAPDRDTVSPPQAG